MVKKNSIKKEEVAEDWCFLCKDGGLLMVCEHKDCNKAYHPTCVGKDDSFVETGSRWTCGWHSCFVCHKNSKFRCFCCPNAVCGRRICGDEFARIKGNKGLCNHCLKLALLIEENIDTDSDGDKIDFKDRETYEGLFLEYYEIIKEKEGLNSLQIQSANKLLKKGRNYSDSDLNEIDEEEDDTGEESNSLVSDYDDLNDTADLKPARKRKRCTRKPNSLKRKVNTKKKEFIGWGSRTLIEFLNFIGKDTRKELSQHDVNSIITGYCKENKLFHPEKKRKVICDEQLQSLFGRKSVNKNSIFNLLTAHLAENVEQMEEDEVEYSSDDRGELVPVGHERRKALSSSKKHHKELVPEVQQSCLASIVTENIKLVYLKRSLVEELLKQPETFDGKLIGSFVRIKSDPNDYLQKNSHQLLQVTGAKRSSNNESSSETLLQLCNFPRDLPICKLSDDDFSEEECKDLCHRMSCGLLQQPTVGVLEQKARSLHEDITKHWIMRQLTLLQIRIDRANEKGWRRELFEYMEQKMLLQSQSEQSRLLHEVPKVIADADNPKILCEDSLRETSDSLGSYSKGMNSSFHLNKGKDDAALDTQEERDQDDVAVEVQKLLFDGSASKEPDVSPLRQCIFDSIIDGRMQNHSVTVDLMTKEKQSVSVADNIELSDNDENKVGNQVMEDPNSCIWRCLGPYGERRGPLSMLLLKRWSETTAYAFKFKVWKKGQSEEEAIFLVDALRQVFPSMQEKVNES